MDRMDINMPFLLKYENVAWFENGIVRILDRRIYPELSYVECRDYREVVQAIADMVTQSAGPYTAVGMGMALAAWQLRNEVESKQLEFLKQAAFELANARPTTANRYGKITEDCYRVAEKAIKEGKDASQAVFENTVASLNRRYSTMQKVGNTLLELIPENGTILTQCFGETIIGTLIRASIENNKPFKVFCAETRPYFQGARLTASCFADMGFDTTLICDNMVAYAMENCKIDLFTSAADSITRDGHIANKVGSYQMAILAKHHSIPYYVSGIPDADKLSRSDIKIEMRDPTLVHEYRGIRNTLPQVKAIYPSFDIVPPELISGIVTDKGIFAPQHLNSYFETETAKFY